MTYKKGKFSRVHKLYDKDLTVSEVAGYSRGVVVVHGVDITIIVFRPPENPKVWWAGVAEAYLSTVGACGRTRGEAYGNGLTALRKRSSEDIRAAIQAVRRQVAKTLFNWEEDHGVFG